MTGTEGAGGLSGGASAGIPGEEGGSSAEAPQRCGVFALAGRSNTGKSTLLNRLLGSHVSIVANRPQTTRQQIRGILTEGADQLVFVDAPGLHRSRGDRRFAKMLNQQARSSLDDADATLFVAAAPRWRDDDDDAWRIVTTHPGETALVLVINKIDLCRPREKVLELIAGLPQHPSIKAVVPLSARRGDNCDHLKDTLRQFMPVRPHLYDKGRLCDRSEYFVAAELLREQLTRQLNQELPYAAAVEIVEWTEEEKLLRISALIYVQRRGQVAIVVGAGGAQLKHIAARARIEMERTFKRHIFLQTKVKVRENWLDEAMDSPDPKPRAWRSAAQAEAASSPEAKAGRYKTDSTRPGRPKP